LNHTQSVLSCAVTLICFLMSNAVIGQESIGTDVPSQFYAIDEFRPIDMGTNTIVYRDARYIGGMKALRQHLRENVVYPIDPQRSEVSGKVLIRCTIGSDGSIRTADIRRSVSPTIDKAVIDAVLSMPLWEPAVLYGLPVETTVVISFKTK
jgi:TonB family protein